MNSVLSIVPLCSQIANRFHAGTGFARQNFPLTRKVVGRDSRTNRFAQRHLARVTWPGHLANAGSRVVALSTCGRISMLVALSWIGGRGSLAVPGSMTNV